MRKTKTTDEFIEDAKKIHGDKYDYSLVNYKNTNTNVEIICEKHGIFQQRPKTHLNGCGCIPCFYDSTRFTQEEFIKKLNIVHNNKYDYSFVNYKNIKTKIKIICPTHGVFEQRASSHLAGQTCFKCSDKQRLDVADFIEKAKIIHNNKYDYSSVKYKNTNTNVEIICSIHGKFKQQPSNHINGYGCPKCSCSLGESIINNFLSDNKIKYSTQKTFEKCKNKRLLPFDFYLIDYNTCIEYDGKQHFEPNDFFGGSDGFEKLKYNDNIKNEYCNNNNIRLIRIKYNENILDILNYFISK